MRHTDNTQFIESIASVDGVSLSKAMEILSAPERRVLLGELSRHAPPVSLETLAERVATRTTDQTAGNTDGVTVHRTAVSLHHSHLPKLASNGLLEYDTRTKTVRRIAPELFDISTERKPEQFLPK